MDYTFLIHYENLIQFYFAKSTFSEIKLSHYLSEFLDGKLLTVSFSNFF